MVVKVSEKSETPRALLKFITFEILLDTPRVRTDEIRNAPIRRTKPNRELSRISSNEEGALNG